MSAQFFESSSLEGRRFEDHRKIREWARGRLEDPMHRRLARPFGQSVAPARIFSLLMALLVIGMLYTRARDPLMWRWFAAPDVEKRDEAPVAVAGTQPAAAQVAPESIVVGPNDLDPEEQAKFQSYKDLITDRTPLRPREMLPYWQFVEWSRTQSTTELEKRAQVEPAFTLVWEHPERYRGQLIRLRMHVRRVLQYDASENSLGLKVLYEAWGWTDESKSFPYVVVFSEKPPGLPVGNEVEAEVVFVGYFLKMMSYTAFDSTRGAPLLVGRLRMNKGGSRAAPPVSTPLTAVVAVVCGITVFAGVVGWWWLAGTRPKVRSTQPVLDEGFAADKFLTPPGVLPDFQFDQPQQSGPAAAAPVRAPDEEGSPAGSSQELPPADSESGR